MDVNEITNRAISFARKNKKHIAKELTDASKYPPEEKPVSVFMAGSPGAGKTEASTQLIKNTGDLAVLRIDADELRTRFKEYNGRNSSLFQSAVSILVDKIHDLALKNSQSFVLDGTLSNLDIARSNISRSINKNRFVLIIYVYQEPTQAWAFVKARETMEGRKVTREIFINQYFEARKVVNTLKSEFKKAIEVDVLLKNNDGSDKVYRANVDQIDAYIPEKYSRDQLEKIIVID